MRFLTESEKEDVKKLLNTRGFEIMKGLVTEYKNDLFSKFATKNLSDSSVIEELTQTQNHMKGINDFILTIEGSTKGVGKRTKD